MKPYAWLDKKLVLLKSLNIDFIDDGFLYGQGLFETMRSYSGKVFLLERHLQRLVDSCPVMDIKAPKEDLLAKAVQETVVKNKISSAYVRLNVYKKNKGTGVFVFAKGKNFYKTKDYKKGFSAAIMKDIKQNENSPLVRVKSLNHYLYILLSKKATDLGADEAIILNSKGNICEGSRSNIFIVKKGIIFTPPVDAGCLPGVTRQAVIDIAKELKLDLFQIQIKPSDLFSSSEAFLTNSLIEIMPLVKVDNKVIGHGNMGDLTRVILAKYRSWIDKNYK